ncbi:Gfo/Idh/MocA family protein [Propionibacteriaceae bacterium Y1685]|uniref:Gfo/Idh/MocA family protein n=1 Tax=Microlunatus sp. Y1700 TaxID=3418487 RepID=UPI003B76C312
MTHEGSETTGVLIIGVGFIAGAHVGAIAASSRAELVGVVDADPARAAAFSYGNGGVPWTADLTEALARPEVDAVIICTPNGTHEAIGMAAAAAGKHVLVEKPLATSVAAARRMEQASATHGTVLMAAHTHRFYDYGRSVAEVINSGEIGTPHFARLVINGGWIWPDWNAWMIDPVKSGGHSLHNGVHLLDLVTWWLGGEPVRVFARGHKQTASELGIHDHLEMTVELDNGASAICEMSRAHRIGAVSQRELLVLGDAGVIEQDLDGDSAQIITESGIGLVPTLARNGFAIQLEAWLDAVRGGSAAGALGGGSAAGVLGGGSAAMSTTDAVRAVALGVASEESIRTGVPVELAAVLAGRDA